MDITAANSDLQNKKIMCRRFVILQSVASGLLGKDAFAGEQARLRWDCFCIFVIAIRRDDVFYLASPEDAVAHTERSH